MKEIFIKRLLWIAGICTLLLAIPYIIRFHGGLATTNGDWNTFGTYFGGVLSPLFSFLSLVAILIIFREEMKLKRIEIGEVKKDIENEREKQELKNEEENIVTYINWIESRINNIRNTIKRTGDLDTDYSSAEYIFSSVRSLLSLTTVLKANLEQPQTKQQIQKLSNILSKLYDQLWMFDGVLDLYIMTFDYIENSSFRDKYLPIYKTYLFMNIVQLLCLTKTKRLKRNIIFKKYLLNEFGEDAEKALMFGDALMDMGDTYTKLVDEHECESCFDFSYITKIM